MNLLQSLTGGVLAAATLGSLAAADGVRIPVGDLGQRDTAITFQARLDAAANRICRARYSIVELAALSACRSAVREEGLDQLAPAQREALSRSLRGAPALASASR